MKKLMTIALAAVFASSAFAQNPDALKQIKKCKNYAEAQALVKANESSMTASENAQAYNKLVDLSYGPASNALSTIQTNQAMAQMGGEAKPVDMNAFYANVYQALTDALVCDKYDEQPNEKGKVAPKFRKANADRLATMRLQIVNGGQEAQNNEDKVTAQKYYGAYAETGASELFKEVLAAQAKNNPNGVADEYLSEVARVAAFLAFQNKDLASSKKYTDIMIQDPEKFKEALQLKMYFMQQNLENHADSINMVNQLKELYVKYPDNADVFSQLAQAYGSLGMTAEQTQVIADRLAKDPNTYVAWALKGQNDMNAKKYDEAISEFQKASECTVEDPKQKALVLFYIGYCYQAKAAEVEKYDDQIAFVKQAIPFLEQAKEIDPQRELANWGYTLYNCYYNVYGENDAKTQTLKAELGY